MSNEIRIKATLEDKVSSGLDKIRDRFDKLGGPGASASLFGNVGAKAVAAGFGLIDTAASAVVGALGNMIDEGIKGQQSQDRLAASLQANVKNWNGNFDAINNAVTANQNLGFSDDETKDSLSRLVAATHDVTKAMQVQSVAADLARFKGISLSDATDALTKIEAGRFKGLASLGIQLKKGATLQDALTAVENVARGQADAFANTTGGKLLVAQTKWNDAIQKAGEQLLPLVADGLNVVTGALDILGKAFDDTANSAKASSGTVYVAALRYGRGVTAAHDATVALDTATTALAAGGLSAVRDHSHSAADAVDDMSASISGSTKTVNYADRAFRNYLDLLASGAFGGAKAADIVKAAQSDLIYARAHPGGGKARAAGGPVDAGNTYTVGESGPETLVMGSRGGYVIPNSGGGGGGLTINFNSMWPPTPAQARAIADVVSAQLAGQINRAAPTIGRA